MFKFVILFLYLFNSPSLISSNITNISEEQLNYCILRFGSISKKRILKWNDFINETKKKSILEKLKLTNNFLNQLKLENDIRHWGVNKYDASIYEFLSTAIGDSEDFAIAKLITLLKLGIPIQKLRISKVKIMKSSHNKKHVILEYHHKVNSIPIILDIEDKNLKLLSKRKDLQVIGHIKRSSVLKRLDIIN